MATAVLFVQNTTVNSITSFHDQISNEIPKILDPWSFELKIYRVNPLVSKLLSLAPPTVETQQQLQTQASKTLYTLSLSYHPHQTVLVINKNCTLFSTDNSQPEAQKMVSSGCSTGVYDSLDSIIQNKLSGSWLLKQSLRGEGGNSYQVLLDNGDLFVIRTANCFLHGNFKGFLIEITFTGNSYSTESVSVEDGIKKIKDLTTKLNFPKGKLSVGKLDESKTGRNLFGDLTFQYTQALQF